MRISIYDLEYTLVQWKQWNKLQTRSLVTFLEIPYVNMSYKNNCCDDIFDIYVGSLATNILLHQRKTLIFSALNCEIISTRIGKENCYRYQKCTGKYQS